MTVGTQMQQALANLESTKSDMQTFALQTQDKQAKAKDSINTHSALRVLPTASNNGWTTFNSRNHSLKEANKAPTNMIGAPLNYK